jgi:hypothetical protein
VGSVFYMRRLDHNTHFILEQLSGHRIGQAIIAGFSSIGSQCDLRQEVCVCWPENSDVSHAVLVSSLWHQFRGVHKFVPTHGARTHWSPHRENNRNMEQVSIPLISLETVLRLFDICRVRRLSSFKRMQGRFGFI